MPSIAERKLAVAKQFDDGAIDAHEMHLAVASLAIEENAILRAALESLRAQPIDDEPGHWAIKCIEDFNAIIEEALNA